MIVYRRRSAYQPLTVAITSPIAGSTVGVGYPYEIEGTISAPGTVVLRLADGTVLGSAIVTGLDFSLAWTPLVGELGAQTIIAIATATSGGATATSPGIAVTVTNATPLSLAGNANLGGWLHAGLGITLQATLAKLGAGGVMTIAGTLAQSLPLAILISDTGTATTCKMQVSIDGAQTFLVNSNDGTQFFTAAQASTALAAVGLTLSLSAATYNVGATYVSAVATWVEQKNGYIFTAFGTPALRRKGAGLEVCGDGTASYFVSQTAGIATSWNVAAAPFNIFAAMRAGALTAASSEILTVSQSAAGTKFMNFFTKLDKWSLFTGGAADSAAGAILPGAYQHTEAWQTGAAVSVLADGTLRINAVAQTPGTDNTLNQMVLLAVKPSGVPNAYGDHGLSEIVWYTGNQHAITTAPLNAYLAAGWVDTPSTILADANFSDCVSSQTVAGVNPVTYAPNDYRAWAPDKIVNVSNTGVGCFRRIKFTVPVGTTSVLVSAVPSINPALASQKFTDCAVYIDGVYSTTLTFTGALGFKQTRAIALDGAAHTLEIDEKASVVALVGVGGAVTIVPPVAPATRVVCYGDSITYGFPGDLSKAWATLMRHALGATYGTTIWGISGKQGSSDMASSPLVTATVAALVSMFDGTSKNILIDAFGTNDYGIGSQPASTYQTNLGNLFDALHTALPALKIVKVTPFLRTGDTVPNSSGSTLANFRTADATVVSARSSYCTLVSGPSILLDSTSTYLVDGLHPNNFGYGLIASALQTVVQSL